MATRLSKKEKAKMEKDLQDKLMEKAKLLIDNPPEIEIEETKSCQHLNMLKLVDNRFWYECLECGNVFGLIDVIQYRDKMAVMKDFAEIIENYEKPKND